MFWRFGFHNASSIDALLDRDDIAVEDLLDEDELLQECKAQNTRLIGYFQRIDVLQRLLGYVAGTIEGEEKGHFKYPYVATEALCSEIWSIVEACVANSDQLLAPFWDTVLDRPPDDMKTRSAMAAHFSKINGVFFNKKPAEMLAFIKSQPSVIARLIMHIEMPAIVDLLFRIIQLDESPSGAGVLEWLSSEKLISRLVDLLSPSRLCEIHSLAADVIKGIITMSAPSPKASALSDGLQHVPACNLFARELASKENISKLLHFMLDEVSSDSVRRIAVNGDEQSNGTTSGFSRIYTDSEDEEERTGVVTTESVTSSLIHSISVVIELIRKNNSDYFEPYLFHNIRNRLIQVQQQLHMHSEDGREVLEQSMKELVDRMGIVNLGGLLESFCARLDDFENLLRHPRSLHGQISTTVGQITPLTLERFRICELYAELLHCSNMALLNRSPGSGPVYDQDGRLQGGLSALEELARVISVGNEESNESEDVNNDSQDVVEAKELPVHSLSSHSSRSTDSSSLASDSDSELSDHSSDDALDDVPVSEHSEALFPIRTRSREPLSIHVSSDISITTSPDINRANSSVQSSHNSGTGDLSLMSNSDLPSVTFKILPVGDILKKRFMEADVVSTLLDFFFRFPWNNFLHNTVYDFIHQILTGRTETGLNRSLIIALFRDARLLHRIVEGQNENDRLSRQPKAVRLGYMGHLTLISEDLISALEHYPEDLATELRKYAPRLEWDRYVEGGYRETKLRDTTLLGGGKPVITSGSAFQKGRWPKVDEEDTGLVNGLTSGTGKTEDIGAVAAASALQGEFRRMTTASSSPRNTAHFEPTQQEEEAASSSQFARYLAEEIHATPVSQFVSTSYTNTSDDDDDDEENGGWLASSAEVLSPSTIGDNPSTSPAKPSSAFDDSFILSTSSQATSSGPSLSFPLNEDDDGFGPFSDVSVSSDGFALDQDDSQFDFGDFQVAEESSDGEMTPTGDSWTFESGVSSRDAVASFSDSNKGIEELKDQLEATLLEARSVESKPSRHERTPSTTS